MPRSPAFAALAFALAFGGQAASRAPAEPFAAVWYRGGPDGSPRRDDLGALRAYGFASITWPAGAEAHLDDVRRLAGMVGLHVLVRGLEAPLTPLEALRPTHTVRISVGGESPGPAALAWRALLHGARVVTFDAGEAIGAGLTDPDGRPRPWVEEAAAVARHLAFNGRLLGDLVPGPDVTVVPPRPAGLDFVLRQTGRVWVLGATNTSAAPAHGIAQLPAGLPVAGWVNLLDGGEMTMHDHWLGPRWTFDLAPGGARLYAIDKPSSSSQAFPGTYAVSGPNGS